MQYFQEKFKCPIKDSVFATSNHSVGHSHCRGFDGDFENFFGVAAMLPIVIMGAVNIWLQSK